MRKIILMMSVSIDGFIEGPNRELDWHMVFFSHQTTSSRSASPRAALSATA